MRVALFARYSSKLQDELSLEAQLSEMETYVAKQAGWAVVRRFLLPETRSADVEKSEEFQGMVYAARKREFDVLLVHKLDRFGRDRETSVVNKAMLRRLGITVRSVVENLGDSIMDRAMEGMMEVMAEWYSGNLAAETRKGQRALTRKGQWTGGKVPFGLAMEEVREGEHVRKRFAAHPTEAPVMAKIYEMVAGGKTTKQVQAYIEEATGKAWQLPTLYTRVGNPIYYGLIQYGLTTMPQGRRRTKGEEVTESRWEGLVSEELWQKANATRKARGKRASGSSRARIPYLLSGCATCLRCGGSIVGGTEHGDRRYSCTNRRGGTCAHASISARKLEGLVLANLQQFLAKMDLGTLVKEYEATLGPQKAAAASREAGLRKSLNECRKKLKNLLVALEQGIIFDDMQQRIKTLKSEEGELADAIGRCQMEAAEAVGLNVAVVREYLQAMRAEADPSKLGLLIQHAVRLELDLVEKRCVSYIGIPRERAKPAELSLPRASAGENPRLYDGRSARTFLQTGEFRWTAQAGNNVATGMRPR